MNLEQNFSAWCKGELKDSEFQLSIESSMRSLHDHQQNFERTLSSLDDRELLHCESLQIYCTDLMDRLGFLLEEADELTPNGSRARHISVVDQISRISYQLNAALLEFKNQVLLVRGPTEIPNLNLLYSLKAEYENSLDPASRLRFLEAVACEIKLAKRGVRELESETVETQTLQALKGTFQEHIRNLRALRLELEICGDDSNPDFLGYLLQLNLSYAEINKLTPLVSVELKNRGETEFPELNLLLTLVDDVRLGNSGEEVLLRALDKFEDLFEQLDDQLSNEAQDQTSEEQLDVLSEAMAAFAEGCNLVHEFTEFRDVALLREAKTHFLELASALSHLQKNSDSRNAATPAPLVQPTFVMTERLANLYQAVDNMLLSRTDDHAFLTEVASFSAHLESQIRKIGSNESTAPLRSMLSAMTTLRRFTLNRKKEELKQGLLTINRAAQQIQRLFPSAQVQAEASLA